MNPKPLFLIPWYGRWPDYLPLFLDGCRRNPDFEVCLFGSDPPPQALPPSVRFVPLPLAELERRFSTTGVEVKIREPYKLCDLKPVLGMVFQDYLQEREFWGFGDLDLVWGDLRRFASPEVLRRVDIFCVRKEYVSGSFTLIRNNPAMNALFMRSPDWQRALTSPDYLNFDECAFKWPELIAGARYEELTPLVHSFSEVVFRAVESGEIRGYFESIALEWLPASVEVTERGIFSCHINYALLHFVIMKKLPVFAYPTWSKVPAHYTVTPGGLFLEHGLGKLAKLCSLPLKKWTEIVLFKTQRRVRHLGAKLIRRK